MARLPSLLVGAKSAGTKTGDFIVDTLNELKSKGIFKIDGKDIEYEYNPHWPKRLRVSWGSVVRLSDTGATTLRCFMWLTLLALPIGFGVFCILSSYFPKNSLGSVEGFFGCVVAGYILYRIISELIEDDFNRRVKLQLEQRASSLAYEPARMIIEALMVYHAVKHTRPLFATKKSWFGRDSYPNSIAECMLPPLVDAIELTLARLDRLQGPNEVAARAVRQEYDERLGVASKHVSDLWAMWDRSISPPDLLWRSIGNFTLAGFLINGLVCVYSLVTGIPF